MYPCLSKARRTGGGITDGATNIFVSEIVLYQSGVISAFSESKTTGMAQHVWMNADGQSVHDGICADNLPETLTDDMALFGTERVNG
ncbi:hypothetical protein RG30_24200 (plasmid) [Escherichia coli]|nr:hypothetical protein RG30_24200 [Escherichia coli]